MSTFTLTPSDDRTAATGTSNATSRVVTTCVSASTGFTQWTPPSRTPWWRPDLRHEPDRPGRDAQDEARHDPDEERHDRAHDDDRPQGEEQRQEQAGRPEADREQDPHRVDGRLPPHPDEDRDPALRIGLLDGVGDVERGRDGLGDLEVLRGGGRPRRRRPGRWSARGRRSRCGAPLGGGSAGDRDAARGTGRRAGGRDGRAVDGGHARGGGPRGLRGRLTGQDVGGLGRIAQPAGEVPGRCRGGSRRPAPRRAATASRTG